MIVFKDILKWAKWGSSDGACLALGKKTAADTGAKPDTPVEITIRKENGRFRLIAEWTPEPEKAA